MDSKVSEKDMREVYFQAFGKEYDSADRKQAPLPLEIAYIIALKKLKREGKYAGGGEITNDTYYESVNHFIYFCMNYPRNFLDAFGSLKNHLSNKFKNYYNKYGTYGVMIQFYAELDAENRRVLTDYSLKNYKGTPISSDISEVEYFNSVNHFIFFCFNFPSNFMDAFSSHLKVHLSSKWTNAYEKKGSVGAMIYFWSELDSENRKKLADWVRINYTGTKLYEVGGALGDVAGMLPSPLPMSTIQAMAKGGNISADKFIKQVKSMHNNIEEVVLKDGTHIAGKDLMANGGGVKSDYYIFEGVDNLNGKPIYRVESTSESDNEYVGEWHKDRNDAEKELNSLSKKPNQSLGVVKVIFENPEYNYTTNVGVNVTEEEARNYFVGKMFDVGTYPKENMQRAIDIEFSKSKDNYADGGGVNTRFVSGTKAGVVHYLTHKKYILVNDVYGAKASNFASTYTNIKLPKGSIVNNLAGGVFVENDILKEKYKDLYSSFGLMIIQTDEILTEIANNSNVIEFSDGGEIVDLFEDYENIPANVQEVLDRYYEKYGEDFGEMNYNDMAEMHKEIEKLGYTFDSGLDNMPYGLRPIGVELNQLRGYEEYGLGGFLLGAGLGAFGYKLYLDSKTKKGKEKMKKTFHKIKRKVFKYGGEIEDRVKEKLSRNFALPFEVIVYVPSTQDADTTISESQFKDRIIEVETYLAKLFGGFSSNSVDGGYNSDEKGLIKEDVFKVFSFASRDGFEPKMEELVNQVKKWCKIWGQEAIGLEFEGDLFYIEA